MTPGSSDSSSEQWTWTRLVDGITGAVERYKRAINNSDRSEFVLRAEHISDYLRLLLIAASGTTDNHSGNPSIISSNPALFPQYRLIMARFSKLVLSSHIACSDWPPRDSYSKCLAEAKGVLNGVQGFVEVAKSQRGGEALPPLIPYLEPDSLSGGNWQTWSDGKGAKPQDEDETGDESDNAHLAFAQLERLHPEVVSELCVLAGFESVGRGARTVSAVMQAAVVSHICRTARRLLERMSRWNVAVESVNVSGPKVDPQSALVAEFAVAKQTTYDCVADIVLGVQDLGSPLADEWAVVRGPTFENRLHNLLTSGNELETNIGTVLGLVRAIVSADGDDTASASPAQIGSATGDRTKVRRFFGEVPPGAMAISTTAPDVPHFLRLDYENEIAYELPKPPGQQSGKDSMRPDKSMSTASSGTPILRGGTLMGLVEQLTRHDRPDSQFNSTFLLTYKSFTTAQDLFEILMTRWSIQPPAGLSSAELAMWTERKQNPIRLRVVNIIKNWVETYWVENDSPESRDLLERIYGFACDEVVKTNTPGSGPLLSVIDHRLKSDTAMSKKVVLTLTGSAPPPIMPKNIKRLKFLDIDPTELARQLTIIEARLYCQIKPSECLTKIQQKQVPVGVPDVAPNVRKLILHSNLLTNWVAHMILMQKDLRPRVIVMKHFIAVANRCRQLNNFSTLTAIVAALGTSPINRLHRTWAGLSAKSMVTLESLRKLMDRNKNFAEYRDTLQKSVTPCIPFIGVYLTDLTFIDDGMPSMIKRTNLINFAKRAKTAEIIWSIQAYQTVQYALQPVQPLIDYINSNLVSAQEIPDDMYELSLQVEPQEPQGNQGGGPAQSQQQQQSQQQMSVSQSMSQSMSQSQAQSQSQSQGQGQSQSLGQAQAQAQQSQSQSQPGGGDGRSRAVSDAAEDRR